MKAPKTSIKLTKRRELKDESKKKEDRKDMYYP